jgi:hypothetical protein
MESDMNVNNNDVRVIQCIALNTARLFLPNSRGYKQHTYFRLRISFHV